MKPRFLFVSALLCLSISIINAHTGSAQQVQPIEPEWLQEMYTEGWAKVQEGVLQRDTGGGQLETFSFGAEGLQWVVQEYEQRIRHLESRYEQAPVAHLAVVVARLKAEAARLSEEIATAPSASTVDNEISMCAFDWGADAYAGPQSGRLGVTATAQVYLQPDCGGGESGDTFAMAYAHAINFTTETTVIQNNPKSGTWYISSYATASANGSTGCESAAQASISSSELSFYYQTPYVQNFECSPTP